MSMNHRPAEAGDFPMKEGAAWQKNTKPVHGPGGRGPKGPTSESWKPRQTFYASALLALWKIMQFTVFLSWSVFSLPYCFNSTGYLVYTQTLIDSYILPLIGRADPDFSGLLHAIMRVAVLPDRSNRFLYIYTYHGVVSRGTLKTCVMTCLPIWRTSIRYFDTHYHGDTAVHLYERYRYTPSDDRQSMPQFEQYHDHRECICQHTS